MQEQLAQEDSLEDNRTDFDPKDNTMSPLYGALGVSTPQELDALFTKLDQTEMKAGDYNYENEESLLNKIKKHLEGVDVETLTEEEVKWRNEMLWLWNHHATSMALFGHRDHEAAQEFVDKSLSHMPDDHPNKITRLLYFLSRGDVESAELWARNEVGENEQAAAQDAIQNYKEHVLN